MRSLSLAKSGITKIRNFQTELKASDFESSLKSLLPGEWCYYVAGNESYVGFVNPRVDEKYSCAHVVGKFTQNTGPLGLIQERLRQAILRRKMIRGYESNARMVYGASDGLPGLLVDSFKNATIIQINTAGIDRFREEIRDYLEQSLGKKAYFLDNPKYREKEHLPVFSNEALPHLEIEENGLRYKVRSEVLQKIGFYYDHRENRKHLMGLISLMESKPERGVDLFSYAGAWGVSALKAGCQSMIFIDQGDFSDEVHQSLRLNEMEGRGEFSRSDVFKFLDDANHSEKTFDLILCDPPAFAKNPSQKSQALDGYTKLHRKVFRIASKRCIIAFSSCTHYVGHDEFQKNILDCSLKEQKKIQLVYCGMQGFDHPQNSLGDKANYIKSYFYMVE